MASLTKRIVVRMSEDLDQWISEQAENEGLDSATWVRATLMRMRKGTGSIMQDMAMVETNDPTHTVTVRTPLPETNFQPESPVDIDAIVSEGLDQAIALGQAEADVAQEEAQSNGVRALVRRAPPFSMSAQPGWIK